MVGHLINPFVEWQHLLTYLQAALRVYNMHGRRDNKFKARIKILVKDLTPEVYAQQVDEQWQLTKDGPDTLTQEYVDTIANRFTWPDYDTSAAGEHDPTEIDRQSTRLNPSHN